MSNAIVTKVIEEMNELPDDLQQQVLNLLKPCGSNIAKPLAMPGMSSNPSQAPSKPQPIGPPSMTITSTAPPNTRNPSHESRASIPRHCLHSGIAQSQ
jgi:hypothetical protein